VNDYDRMEAELLDAQWKISEKLLKNASPNWSE
jgi:hypothetical protein